MKVRIPLVLVAAAVGLIVVLAMRVGAPKSILIAARTFNSKQPQQPATGASAPPSGSSSSTTTSAGGQGAAGSGSSVPLVALRRSAVGAAEQYGYGILSVRVTAVGNRIESVSVQRLQTAEQYSQQLAQQVIPMLRGEVLAAQSAQINGISGASYTSQAYALSLQSALDKLHVA